MAIYSGLIDYSDYSDVYDGALDEKRVISSPYLDRLNRFTRGDAVSDEEFESCYSPKEKKEIDKIENMTLQIFARLLFISDGIDRTEVMVATTDKRESSDDHLKTGRYSDSKADPLPPSPKPRNTGYHLRKDTHFFETDYLDRPVHTKHVLENIASLLTTIFFGSGGKNLEEMNENLSRDEVFWKDILGKNYTPYYLNKIKSAFVQAKDILKDRQDQISEARYQRITLYASLIISFVGAMIQQKMMKYLGIISATITLIFMLTHYGTSSFRQAKLSSELKLSLEQAQREAIKYRIN